MRLKNTLNNAVANITLLLLRTVLMFISRLIFARILGQTYLGVNGLMTNVISMLSLAELGISTAISFSLYKPLADGDTEKISSLMNFYRRAYQIIGAIVGCGGLILLPFLNYVIKGGSDIDNLRLIYLLYLLNSVLTYYIAYKETLINAAQKNYKLAPFNALFTILIIVVQTVLLVLFRNYIIYLAAQIILSLVQRIVINRYITKMFPEISFNTSQKLPAHEKSVLARNVKGMLFHKLGEYSIYGTDNLVISAFIHITVTGIYSNYSMIISTANSLLNVLFNSATASFGDLFARDEKEKQYVMFLRFEFLAFIVYGWTGIGMLVLLTPIVSFFFGPDYILSSATVLLLCINFYMMGMRIPVNILKQAAGIYYEDRFIALLHGLLNLVLSIPLAIMIGLNGVFLGTVLSGLVSQIIKPYIFYRKCFSEKSMWSYWKRHLLYMVQLILITAVTVGTVNLIRVFLPDLDIIIGFALSIMLPGILFILFNFRLDGFQYYWNLAINILKRGRNKW